VPEQEVELESLQLSFDAERQQPLQRLRPKQPKQQLQMLLQRL
jgi:hypothetical protein